MSGLLNLDRVELKNNITNILENENFLNNVAKAISEKTGKDIGSITEKEIRDRTIYLKGQLVTAILELNTIMVKTENSVKISNLWWWKKYQGIGETIHSSDLYEIEDYDKAFKLVNKIAAILRGEEDIILRVQRVDSDGNITIYEIPESKLITHKVERKGKNGLIEQLEYNFSELKNSAKERKVSKSFQNHFNLFKNQATNFLEKKTPSSLRYNFNEGTITEAFYRHLYQTHKGESYYSNSFNEDITEQQTAIDIYYSINTTGWWKAGDVANVQIKGNNERLASIQSIKIIANQLLMLFADDKFNWNQFNLVFTEKEKELTKDNLKNIGKKLGDTIKQYLEL